MITANILQRVLQVRCEDKTGTAFTIEVDGKQYLISAKHVFQNGDNDLSELEQVHIFKNNKWRTLKIKPILCENEKIDIICFSLEQNITPSHELIPSMANLVYSQDVYFLGFPYGMNIDTGDLNNNNYPFPFVKKGIVSALDFASDIKTIYIDGHANTGFSGGPIVFSTKNKLCVAGIISKCRLDTKEDDKLTSLISENSGIFYGHSIKYAVDAIKKYSG